MAGQTDKLKKQLAKEGHSENMANKLALDYDKLVEKAPEPPAKCNLDTPLMQPTKDWDETDKRRGNYYGRIIGPTIVSMPSREFTNNFDQIDWSK